MTHPSLPFCLGARDIALGLASPLMDPKQPDRWLNRNVVGLAVNRFLSDLGHEAGTSVLPLFLAAIGAPAAALGWIEGVADALSSFTKLLGGQLGDRVERRKPWATGAYLLTGVTTRLYGGRSEAALR